MSKEDRAAYQSADTMVEQAEALGGQGKYAAAEPLREKVLEIRRRLLTDDHPDTAENYNNLAVNLYIQGKYAQAQPLFEKALEIWPPPAHRRPPGHRRKLSKPGSQPQRPGEVGSGPGTLREGARNQPPLAPRR